MTTATQVVTEDLRRWIVAQADAGCRPADLLMAMKTSGWEDEVAIAAIDQALRERRAAEQAHAQAAAGGSRGDGGGRRVADAVPEPLLEGCGSTLTLSDGHRVEVLATLRLPRVVVFGGLLSDDECRDLVDLASPRLLRSETVDNATGGSEVNAARTSDGMFFERGEHPLVAAVESRIAELLRWPVAKGEGLQILRYRPGAEYRPHHDYFDPAHPGTARVLRRGGQRVGTLVIYLRSPDAGGATTFPDVGFEVAPVRGNAVFFSYDRAHASTKTLHGGAPVTAGEKWVATKWLRESEFV